MKVERRAVLGGVDHTARCSRRCGLSPIRDSEALDRCADGEPRRGWSKLGLAALDEYDSGRGWERHLAPMWTVKETLALGADLPGRTATSSSSTATRRAPAEASTPLWAFPSSAPARKARR